MLNWITINDQWQSRQLGGKVLFQYKNSISMYGNPNTNVNGRKTVLSVSWGFL